MARWPVPTYDAAKTWRAQRATLARTGRSIDKMDSSWMAVRHRCAKLSLVSELKPYQKECTK
jgi:hypothetical protein